MDFPAGSAFGGGGEVTVLLNLPSVPSSGGGSNFEPRAVGIGRDSVVERGSCVSEAIERGSSTIGDNVEL